MFTSMFKELRYAVRSLLKHRSFTAAALLTLALGIGINTAIFTLLYSVALRPLQVKNPERVVNVYQTLQGEYSRQVEGSPDLLSYQEYINYRDRVAGVSELAAAADLKLHLGEVARSLDKDAFVSVEPLEENVRRMLEPARMGGWFSGTVSLLALIIAATGITACCRITWWSVRARLAFGWHSAHSGVTFCCSS